MSTQKKGSKKVVVSTTKSKIQQIHACISKDLEEISKLYKKSIAEAEKNVSRVTQQVLKAKKSLIQAKKNKAKSPKNYKDMESLLQSLSKQCTWAKTECANLKSEYKIFLAHHKASMKVMNGSARKLKVTSKTKRKPVSLTKKVKKASSAKRSKSGMVSSVATSVAGNV